MLCAETWDMLGCYLMHFWLLLSCRGAGLLLAAVLEHGHLGQVALEWIGLWLVFFR